MCHWFLEIYVMFDWNKYNQTQFFLNEISHQHEDLIWFKNVRTLVSYEANVSFACSTVERVAMDFFVGLMGEDSPTTVEDIE